MDKNRFKRRSDDSARVKRTIPKLDEMGELRITTDTLVDDSSSIIAHTNAENKSEASLESPQESNIKKNLSKKETSDDEALKENNRETTRVNKIQVSTATMQSPTAIPPIVSSSTQETNININISLPKIPEFKLKKPALPTLPNLPYKRILIYGFLPIAAIAITVSCIILIDHHSTKPKPVVSSSNNSQSPNLGLTTPSFTPVAPKDKPQLARGIEGTTFDGSRDTYSFTDVLNGTPLVVSQQPIPAKYNSANDAVLAAAKSIGATTILPTSNVAAYMVTNTKSQSQIIVFSMNGILLFIQSYFTHPASLWADYINNLS